MANSTGHFTAAQVLQAARRAEAEGKLDYALQFYRHLVDHYADVPEAYEARDALQRVANWQASVQPPPPDRGGPAVIGGLERNFHQPGPLRGARPGLNDPSAGLAGGGEPDPYRWGRLAGQALGVVGVLIALAGFAYAGYIAWTIPPAQWAESPIGFPLLSFWGLVAGVAGFVMVVLSQIARAVFDTTEAVAALLENGRYRPGA